MSEPNEVKFTAEEVEMVRRPRFMTPMQMSEAIRILQQQVRDLQKELGVVKALKGSYR